jgi:hypothetical protein
MHAERKSTARSAAFLRGRLGAGRLGGWRSVILLSLVAFFDQNRGRTA